MDGKNRISARNFFLDPDLKANYLFAPGEDISKSEASSTKGE
jgi:hypothetical protein